MHYTCIACITIDSAMKIEKKNKPQVFLGECKYKTEKIKMPKFKNTDLESESSESSESELESDTRLKSDSELESDS